MHTLTVRHFAHATTLTLRAHGLAEVRLSVRERIATTLTVVHIEDTYRHRLRRSWVVFDPSLQTQRVGDVTAGSNYTNLGTLTPSGPIRQLYATHTRELVGIITEDGETIACIMTGDVLEITASGALVNRRDLSSLGVRMFELGDGSRMETADGDVMLTIGDTTQYFFTAPGCIIAGAFDTAIAASFALASDAITPLRIRNASVAAMIALAGRSTFARVGDLESTATVRFEGNMTPAITISDLDAAHTRELASTVTETGETIACIMPGSSMVHAAQAEIVARIELAVDAEQYAFAHTPTDIGGVISLIPINSAWISATEYAGLNAFFLMEDGIPFETETNHKIQVLTA